MGVRQQPDLLLVTGRNGFIFFQARNAQSHDPFSLLLLFSVILFRSESFLTFYRHLCTQQLSEDCFFLKKKVSVFFFKKNVLPPHSQVYLIDNYSS